MVARIHSFSPFQERRDQVGDHERPPVTGVQYVHVSENHMSYSIGSSEGGDVGHYIPEYYRVYCGGY